MSPGLLFGKPIGVLLFAGAARFSGARLPKGLRVADLVPIGIVAAIGFAVSLFFATAAFQGSGTGRNEMGALLSFGAAPLRARGVATVEGACKLISSRPSPSVAPHVTAVRVLQRRRSRR